MDFGAVAHPIRIVAVRAVSVGLSFMRPVTRSTVRVLVLQGFDKGLVSFMPSVHGGAVLKPVSFRTLVP
jgi:hypothetical protein